MAKKPSHPTRWILCTKWFLEKEVEGSKEKVKIFFWKPIGEFLQLKGRQDFHRVFSYATQEEAERDLEEIVRIKEDAGRGVKDLKYHVCEVRYVPNKMKDYNQRWFDKYVVKEQALKIVNPKDEEKKDG